MTDIKHSLIVAMAENNVIGLKNDIPWYIPEDFRYFKAKTIGKPCIMGRKTYESILKKLGKALPGRQSIVVSQNGYTHEQGISSDSLEDALQKAKMIAEKDSVDEIMIIGGAQIYNQAIEKVNRMYITKVNHSYEGDAYFPDFNEKNWKLTSEEDHETYSFLIFDR